MDIYSEIRELKNMVQQVADESEILLSQKDLAVKLGVCENSFKKHYPNCPYIGFGRNKMYIWGDVLKYLRRSNTGYLKTI